MLLDGAALWRAASVHVVMPSSSSSTSTVSSRRSVSTSRDHYEVLGVERKASPSEIKKAFYTKSKLLHPDGKAYTTESERTAATRQFVELKTAYDILRRPADRSLYDLRGSPEAAAREMRRRRAASGYSYPNHAAYEYSHYDWRSAWGAKASSSTTREEGHSAEGNTEHVRAREERQWRWIWRWTLLGASAVALYNFGYWFLIRYRENELSKLEAKDEIARCFLRQSEFRHQLDDPAELENLARILKADVDDAHRRRMETLESEGRTVKEIREEYRWFEALRMSEYERRRRRERARAAREAAAASPPPSPVEAF